MPTVSMVWGTTGSVLVVFLWSLTVVLGQDWGVTYTSLNICALKGSTVDLSCSYSYPRSRTVTTTKWYYWTWTEIPDSSAGRLSFIGNKDNDCTLRITDLRKEDSRSYCFFFKTESQISWSSGPSLDLSVTDLQVKVTDDYMKTLTCISSCPLTDNPTYIWYKNGQHVDESSSQYKDSVSINSRDSYSCGVKGHEDLHSPTVCVSNQYCSRVIYTKRRICVLKGSSVDISCTYNGYYPVTSSLWFSPKQSGRWKDTLIPEDLITDPEYAGRVDRDSGPFTLRITDLREEDSAEYKFRFTTSDIQWGYRLPGKTVTVTDVVLEMDPTSVSEGNTVKLTCTTKCELDPIPEYSWYKNGRSIGNTTSNVYIHSVSSEDAGRYSCGVKGHETLLSPEMTLNVTYGPRNPSVSVSPSGEIVEGSSVTLTCSSDANPPVYNYTWYKKNVTSPKASGQSYNITNITSENSGEYYCVAKNIYGQLNSSAVLNVVPYKRISGVILPAGIVVVLVLILWFSGVVGIRNRRKTYKSPTTTGDTADYRQRDSSPVYDNISDMVMTSTAAQTTETDNQDDLHYASVHFSSSRKQEVPLYSTVQLPQPNKHEEEVEYAAVNINCECC
ncbi:hypothetical protein DPEC_G00170980 [Dallia pectoralis]|uniref:Uncharacterized protein n=1 Tax=Dallia pectoralis TaxID=75939 RepID=A0ACC2GDK4_DALPE|nr:hypothetical protein DPEC_G00170980 [Dallia pectoralis]